MSAPALLDWIAKTAGAWPAIASHHPVPRHALDGETWADLIATLATTDWELLGLWGDTDTVHVALRDPEPGTMAVLSRHCPDKTFLSLGHVRPGAIRLERAAADLHALISTDGPDRRPWLDHGRWERSRLFAAAPYAFLPVEGAGVHQIPVGPVHAGIIEPGHFRFHCNGETVVRLEARLGYVHKGVESLMAGKPPFDAVKLAGRISGDSTVAYALAFSRAVEAATGATVPPRAIELRALMAEIERIANHLGDVGAIANDAAFALLQAECSRLRELTLRASAACFGHRLMMDAIVPGGVATDLQAGGEKLAAMLTQLEPLLRHAVEIYGDKPSLLDRTMNTGIISPELVQRFAAGGYVGRASSRTFDARRSPGYPPYDGLTFDVPVRRYGDVHSRVTVRIDELAQSLGLVRQLLDRLTKAASGSELRATLPTGGGEGLALVEGFRGDILAWVRLGGDGRVVRAHLRDPSWFQWPLLEAAIEGNIVADFPLCNKSVNGSYSGHDL
ncbi:MAG TPA: nickel-dependent hydrogenase large subunit [Candidatus Sulfotelmatobacter sp.]|nr:nickel-dependent hydrogenase large subunit [Candidatus Sulfotelmatobacter sp.]